MNPQQLIDFPALKHQCVLCSSSVQWKIAHLSDKHLFLFYVYEWHFSCMGMCAPRECLMPTEPEDGFGSPGTGVVSLHLGSGSLQEQPVLLTTVPSLQPQVLVYLPFSTGTPVFSGMIGKQTQEQNGYCVTAVEKKPSQPCTSHVFVTCLSFPTYKTKDLE